MQDFTYQTPQNDEAQLRVKNLYRYFRRKGELANHAFILAKAYSRVGYMCLYSRTLVRGMQF